MNYLITCNPNSKTYLEIELKQLSLQSQQWISDEEVVISTPLNFEEIYALVQNTPLVFVRHIFEVHFMMDTASITALPLLNMNPELNFSIQLRSDLSLRKTFNEYRRQWAQTLVEQGFELNVKSPQQIISVYATSQITYIGVSEAYLHLSDWSAGAVHYSHHDYFISRAEFKLREVFQVFPHFNGDRAIDLGAAPGGWSYVLASHNFHTDAVDPAKLDEKLKQNPLIKHYQMSAQTYFSTHQNQKVDLIVNDMKMYALDSINVMISMLPLLSDQGHMVLTLKMPKNYLYRYVEECISLLKEEFTLLFARQLFHNRNEITVVLRKH